MKTFTTAPVICTNTNSLPSDPVIHGEYSQAKLLPPPYAADLNPDIDIVKGSSGAEYLASVADSQIDDVANDLSTQKFLKRISLAENIDSDGVFQLLDEVSRVTIEPPKNHKYGKMYLLNVLSKYTNFIVKDGYLYVRMPWEHHYKVLKNPHELHIFLNRLFLQAETADQQELHKHLSNNVVGRVFRAALCDIEAIDRADAFENDGCFLPAANGIIHVVDGVVDIIDYSDEKAQNMAFDYCVNARFDLSAKSSSWDAFLNDFIGRKDADIERFWQLEGNLLFPTTAAKTISVLYGEGNDGKSTLCHVRSKIMTPSSVCDIDASKAFSKFGMPLLENSRIAILHEMNQELSISEVNYIKKITGGDGVGIEAKFADVRSGHVPAKLTATCNHIPRFATGTVDTALQNRFQMIRVFAVPPKYRSTSLQSALFNERDYYLTRAVQGFAELQKHNYAFTESKKDRRLKETIFSANPAVGFLRDCCIRDGISEEQYLLVKEWKAAVKIWRKISVENCTYKDLKWALINLGVKFQKLTKGKHRDMYAFIGIILNENYKKFLERRENYE